MKVTIKNGRYVFEKDGVFFALSLAQVIEMRDLCDDIIDVAKEKAG
jgi:hypothetical protein